ncbi:MAG: tetratricopeptide repeat protein [Candidatus Wallbacteria bacterium]|nr:tetratricopeptide repeat protein [Candidatus Wallbacteria bacterium]
MSASSAATPRAVGVLDSIRAEIGRLSRALERRPADLRALTLLAEAYLREAQVTGDSSGHARADAAIQRALAVDPQDYAALAAKGWVEYAQHRFAEAAASARRAIALAPEAGRNYALLSDALLELGRYDEAVRALQGLLDRQPGPAGYSRAAHIRFLHGDLDGALEMVELGLESALSGGARDLAAWLYTQAGELHAARGNVARSRRSLELARVQVPGYFRAAGPLARLLANQGQLDTARSVLTATLERIEDAGLLATLEDLETLQGNEAGARAARQRLESLAKLDIAQHGRIDRALALADLEQARNLERATAAAEAEYRERPDIYSADALGWARFRAGRLDEALVLSKEALRLGTKDAALLFRRGTILKAAGRAADGEIALREARTLGLALPPSIWRVLAPGSKP